MGLDRRRGYIRATQEQDGALERWSLPSYGDETGTPKDTALNYDPSWEPPELVDEAEEPEFELTMLTADALEEIRQSAVDEGIEEGRTAGFNEGREAGYEEGKLSGFEKGKEEGYQQGLSDGQQLIENRCQHLDAMLEKLAFPLVQVDHQVQQQVVDMVVHLAKAVIQTEVATNPQIILHTLREAVNALPMAGRQITIYLQPEDLDVVMNAYSEASLRDREWRLIEEPALNRGDIQVACGDSVVDYRMEDRTKQILARFLGQNVSRDPDVPDDQPEVILGAEKVVNTEATQDSVADDALLDGESLDDDLHDNADLDKSSIDQNAADEPVEAATVSTEQAEPADNTPPKGDAGEHDGQPV
ncbi:flagellar assembly protein FliH [Enterovibrio sp. ZSDZ42]|uniref:Flagellar assembly protein FliH n=1 Tax=Enterovibrio gelatinilyticus TaxID=2899819 RepID=A0ABT5QWR1_9GAMM|nr:flagellar assembly protein FliH [Enterovibrio sp. ZSDZ42]MDD1792455.1 flagellar assembly protein FliH [Enterovibrio sp. ZSDZ42]